MVRNTGGGQAANWVVWYEVAAIGVTAVGSWMLLAPPVASIQHLEIVGLAAALVLIGELRPARLGLAQFRIGFGWPLLAAVASAGSPAASVLIALLVPFVAELLGARAADRGVLWREATRRSAVVGPAAFVASFVFLATVGWGMPVAGAAYGGAMALAQAIWVMVAAGPPEKVDLRQSGRLPALAAAGALYVMLFAWSATLAVEPFWPLLVLALGPILLLKRLTFDVLSTASEDSETLAALALMLRRTHPYTHGHLERVGRLAEEVAIRLGLTPERARLVREAAVLHDVGKIAVDEEILDKPSKLTQDEMSHVRKHSAYGARILEQTPRFREIGKWVLHHHERPDGTGYPAQLPDRSIPIESKIIAVADAFDAMVGGPSPGERRPYREPLTVPEALAELMRCSGSQFDRRVVLRFCEVVLTEDRR